MRKAPELQHFFGESMFPDGCLHGECSLLSSFAPMVPRKTEEFFEFIWLALRQSLGAVVGGFK